MQEIAFHHQYRIFVTKYKLICLKRGGFNSAIVVTNVYVYENKEVDIKLFPRTTKSVYTVQKFFIAIINKDILQSLLYFLKKKMSVIFRKPQTINEFGGRSGVDMNCQKTVKQCFARFKRKCYLCFHYWSSYVRYENIVENKFDRGPVEHHLSGYDQLMTERSVATDI